MDNVVTVPSSEEESRADEIVYSIESVSVSKETKMTYVQSLLVVTANGFAVVFVFDQGYPKPLRHSIVKHILVFKR